MFINSVKRPLSVAQPQRIVFSVYQADANKEKLITSYLENCLKLTKVNLDSSHSQVQPNVSLHIGGANRTFLIRSEEPTYSTIHGMGILLKNLSPKSYSGRESAIQFVELVLKACPFAKMIDSSPLPFPGIKVGRTAFYFAVQEDLQENGLLHIAQPSKHKASRLGQYHHHAAISVTSPMELLQLSEFYKKGLGLTFAGSYTLKTPWLCTRSYESREKPNSALRMNTINQTMLSLLLDLGLSSIRYNPDNPKFQRLKLIFDKIGWSNSLTHQSKNKISDLYSHVAIGLAPSEKPIQKVVSSVIENRSSNPGILLNTDLGTNPQSYIVAAPDPSDPSRELKQAFVPTTFGLQELLIEMTNGKKNTAVPFTDIGGKNATSAINKAINN